MQHDRFFGALPDGIADLLKDGLRGLLELCYRSGMSTDQAWTFFVRAWRDVGAGIRDAWLDSPERIRALVAKHPLPWVISLDWLVEVIASDGVCVAKKLRYSEAEAFIATAMEIR